MPVLTVIAGQNGSGKSTFVRTMKLTTIDPDRIAAGYGEGFTTAANVRATREALHLMPELIERNQSFALETTLSGRQPLRLMEQAGEAGYQVHLVFIAPKAEEDVRLRIENRVMEGGHNIPDADIERREPRVLANLPEAVAHANLTALYVSSTSTQDFRLEGVYYNDRLELSYRVPQDVRQALASRFEVHDVEAINQRHPITERFQAHVQRGWGD